MIPTENYLPEWRLYLLKKLVIDSKKLSGRPLTTANFLYVTGQEVKDSVMESLQQEMKFLESIPNRVYAGEKIQVTADSIAFSKGYTPPEFKSLEIINELIELSGEPDAPIKLIKMQISRQYFVLLEKKRLASISSGTFVKDRNGAWTKAVAEGVAPMTPLKIETVKSLLNLTPGLADHMVFNLEIDPAKINKKIQVYLDDFEEQRLIPPKGQRYLAVNEQKTKFLTAIGVLEKRFGRANISTNFTEIIQIIGRENWREESCRFYETLFLLENEGVIKIVDLRGLEVVFSFIQAPAPERKIIELFDVEKEFAKVRRIQDPAAHHIAQEKWLNIKFILGEIGKALPPLKSKLPQFLSLNTDRFSDEQKTLLYLVMEYLLDIGGVELPPQAQPIVVLSSEPLRKVLSGEYAVIGNQDSIEGYISQVYELCDLIERDSHAKFSRRDTSAISKASKAKILNVLEIIHDRYELVPKEPQLQDHGVTTTVGDGGGRIKISTPEFLARGGINFHELEAILGTLKSDGLLSGFEFISEYE
jgi:hypothetical protein